MEKTRLAAVLIGLLVAPAAGAWQMSDLVIYLWGAPDVPDAEASAKALRDAGLTVVDWSASDLDLLEKHGLKAMVHKPAPDVASHIAGHPALWGYHLGDEPYPEDQFPPLADQIRALAKVDPRHPSFVNMLSTTGEFLRTYLKVVRPEILSFDYYQWWWGSDRYFEKLEQFREAALLARVPLGSCIEVTANPGIERGDRSTLPENAVKLRQSVYTNLAYGVKLVEWFNAGALFEPKSVELTAAGQDVKALNREIKKLGAILVKLESQDVYHTPPLARGTREAPREHWVQVSGEERSAGLVLGTFKDEAGMDYFLVANRDYRDAQSVTVRLQSKWLGIAPWHKPKSYKYAVERFDRAASAWVAVTSSSFVGFTFVLSPGDGELFKVTTTLLGS